MLNRAMMHHAKKIPAALKLPLLGMKPLYHNRAAKTLIIEVNIDALEEANAPSTIDEMVAEARLERAMGRTQSFTNADDLIADLRS